MATSQFSASCSRTRPFPHYESRSRLIDFTCRSSKSKLFFTRSLNRKQSRRSFSVKSVSSEPTQKLKDPIADEEASTTLSSLTTDAASVASSIKYHAEFTPSFSPERLDLPKAYFATAQSVRDSLIINWNATYDYYEKLNVKQAYYLSMEFLQGRALLNAVGNLELRGAYAEALNKLGHKLEEIASQVVTGSDGIRHWIGGEDIKAVAHDVPIPGYQTKTTINLRLWSTKAPSEDFDLNAFNSGEHTKAYEALGNAEKICYVLYPGDESIEGKVLRLKQQYTLCSASLQDIIARFERRSGASVNWEEFPEKVAVQMNDTHPTLCIPELMRILIDLKGLSWKDAWNITQRTVAYTNHTVLPEALEKWSFELMQKLLPRHIEIIQLIDEEVIGTIISEYGTADYDLLEKKLKEMRILENVDYPEAYADILVKPKEIEPVEEVEIENVEKVESLDEEDKLGEESPDEKEQVLPEPVPEPPKLVRMANLCVVGGHAVNGVAEIHSEIVKEEVFNSFYQLWPEKFQNKTNGVTPRRWIRFCNPDLSEIITKWIGTEEWVLDTEKLAGLRKFADNEDLHSQWRAAKRNNKLKVVSLIKERTGYSVSPDALFDVQVKRIHEYKRQLLNILGIVYRYKKMKEMTASERKEMFVPRVCIFGGKAFATYVQAKRIVKFITDVGATINHDPEIGDLLKVIFVPDYNVSVAELLIPASELSQHISTAGMEASGTSNMKFSMNGCILIGTLDGANVEIREEVGEDNFFLFGAKAHEIADLRKERAEGKFVPDPRFEEVKEFVRSGVFGPYNYDEMIGSLEGNEGYGRADYFLVGKDFPSYLECQDKVDEAYRDQKKWTRMSILNTAGSYKFSSDRTIHEYAKDIWNIQPLELP
ncbi:hypothetical protein F8388_010165 [Cannabis sativa]|uniref:Alpha-1,4 glucan phosphorylase n=1 Tax=Cannabis sativa TaxID=3483 RepID=A0A7J6GU68_CANSA|nr:hypothetical protein G4B88_029394 [Cannabis sativa]KAF4385609.1 hypothetical protein F8388_010165 [Cannabis sativa]